MAMILYLCFVVLPILPSQGYVLLQVRPHDENSSNVDALIHKVVPSNQLDRITSNIEEKLFKDTKNNTTPEEKEILNKTERRVNKNKKNMDSSESANFHKILNMVKEKFSNISDNVLRTRGGHGQKTVKLRSDVVMKRVSDALTSPFFNDILDLVTKQAAVALRTFIRDIHVDSGGRDETKEGV